MRVQLDVAHDLGERVPLDLREGEKDVFVREQGVLAPARFFDRAVDDALRGFADLARRDVEIVYVHGSPPAGPEVSKIARQMSSCQRLRKCRADRRLKRVPRAACARALRDFTRRPEEQRRIRASVGGCVLKSDSKPPIENGLMMNMCAVAGLASSGTARDAASIFRSALTRPFGLPAMRRAAGVGVELARPRNRRLNQHRRDRRQDHRRQQRDRVAAVAIVAAAAAEEHREARDHHDRRGERRRDRARQDVAVLHVRQFVRDHAFEFVVVQHLQDAFGRRHRRVLRIAAGRERVRRRSAE